MFYLGIAISIMVVSFTISTQTNAASNLTSISPSSGQVAGGDSVTITGSGFTEGMRATIGGTAVQSYTYINETTATAVTAPGYGGARNVVLIGSDGTRSTISGGYTYLEPDLKLTSITPSDGPVVGGKTVTVTGENFTAGIADIDNISTGGSNSCGLYNGKAYCWGANGNGQIGNGSTISSSTPEPVETRGVLAGKTLTSIAVGDNHVCAISSEGLAYCWGYNVYGQLGNNTTERSLEPVAVYSTGVLAGKTVSAITAGGLHTCATTSDGLAYCWGYNYYGQNGNNSRSNSRVPTAISQAYISSGSAVISISAGNNHTCALNSGGKAYCWGYNNYGQLGNNSKTQSLIPVAVVDSGELSGLLLSTVNSGLNQSCAITVAGKAYCWGRNSNGQLGNGTTTDALVPSAVATDGVLAGKTVTTIKTGGLHTCAATSDSQAYCWGYNAFGQLANNSNTQSLVPTQIAQTGVYADTITQDITVGTHHTCAISSDDRAYCWGYNNQGQLGSNSTTNENIPVAVGLVEARPMQLTIGGVRATNLLIVSPTTLTATTAAHTAGLTNITASRYDEQSATRTSSYEYVAKAAITSVSPNSGQQGGGDSITISGTNLTDGMSATIGGETVIGLAYVNDTTVTGIVPTGIVGARDVTLTDAYGQKTSLTDAYYYLEPELIISTVAPTDGPIEGNKTVTITGDNFSIGEQQLRQISTGSNSTCGLYNGKAYCWGYNYYGQLGNGTTRNSSVPVAVDTTGVLAGKVLTSIKVGSMHVCAVSSDGQMYCWGYNQYGQLGNNSTASSSVPFAVVTNGVLAGKTIKDAIVGNYHTCVVASDSKAYCWGYNVYGQLGNNTTTQSNIPVAVYSNAALLNKEVTAISGGYYHTCALVSDGQVFCWGYNNFGQLGNGTVGTSLTPIAVDTSGVLAYQNISSITTGVYHTCAANTNGAVYCWGYNNFGQLGNGATASSSVPVTVDTSGVLAGKTVKSVTGGGYQNCVITTTDLGYCWGYNYYGQLGNGSTTNSPVPVALGTNGGVADDNILALSTGTGNSCAITTNNRAFCWGYNAQGQLGNNTTINSVTPTAVAKVFVEPMKLSFGGLPANDIVFVSPTTLTATTPAHAAGFTDVSVTRYDQGSTTKASSYEYVARATVESIYPSNGQQSGGDSITITGRDLTEGMSLTVGGAPVVGLTYINSTTLTGVVPSGIVGARDVILTDVYDQQTSLIDGYHYDEIDLILTSITPTEGPIEGNKTVTVTGENFSIGEQQLRQISVGNNSTCGLYNGKAYCWGYNYYGQLGNGSTKNSLVPVAVDTSGVLAGKTLTEVKVGGQYACATTTEKQIVCWGYNRTGQLGDGSLTDSSVPVTVKATGVLAGKNITQFITSNNSTCVIASDAKPYCWGDNGYGQLGNNSITDAREPVAVYMNGTLLNKTITSISGGYYHTCALASDSQAYCWGYNSQGQLGDGSQTQSRMPVAVDSSGVLYGKNLVAISSGVYHNCVLSTDAETYCWGYNAQGQLGNGSTANSTVPVAIDMTGVLAGKTIESLSGGGYQNCVLTSDSKAYCWGYNNFGQLGIGTTTNSYVPVAVDTTGVLAGKPIQSIAAGFNHSCAIAIDNRAYCWGYNAQGQLGNNSVTNSTVPTATSIVQVSPMQLYLGGALATNLVIISPTTFTATTPSHVAGLADVSISRYDQQSATRTNSYEYVARATITAVSPNSGQQAGGDSITISGIDLTDGMSMRIGSEPVSGLTFVNSTTLTGIVPAGIIGSRDVVLTDIYDQQTMLPNGYNYLEPDLAFTNIAPSNGPIAGGKTVTITGENFKVGIEQISEISGGANSTCGLYNHQAYCWGYNAQGQLGNNTTTGSSVPVAVDTSGVLAGKTLISVKVGGNHACAISTEGQQYCWGDNGYGQLGNNTLSDSKVPVAVYTSGELSGKSITTISVGNNHTCAITSEAKAYCWGDNGYAQMGNNSITDTRVPVAVYPYGVLSGKAVTSISASNYHTCAVTSEGKAYCWGYNPYGQLGNNSITQSRIPVAVDTNGVLEYKTIVTIATGLYHTCVTSSDSQVYCWGYNAQGQLGNNSQTDSRIPIAVDTSGVLAGKALAAVTTGNYHSCVVSSDGQAYCWGYNPYGHLGNNSTTQSLVPVPIVTAGDLAEKTLKTVVAGANHTCAIASDNQAYCWGYNGQGQLGDSTKINSYVPLAVSNVQIRSMQLFFGGVPATDVVLLSPTSFTATTPANPAGLTDVTVTRYDEQSITRTSSYEYVAKATITSISPNSGQQAGGESLTITGTDLTDGMSVTIGGAPLAALTYINSTTITGVVPAGIIGSQDVELTDTYNLKSTIVDGYRYIEPALNVTGIAPNNGPAIGGQNVTITGENFSVGREEIREISTGGGTTCGLYNNKAYCWGNNNYGQLGNGSKTDTSVPVAVDTTGVLSGKSIVSISVGYVHVCAVASDNLAYCWGYNAQGQLGNGSTTLSTVPVAVRTSGVLAGKDITTIEAGEYFTCAVSADGLVYCWGQNSYGQLGNNSTTSSSIPMTVYSAGVLVGKTLIDIKTGDYHACALTIDGEVYCWGYNAQGQLGNNSTTQSTIPVAVDKSGVLAGKSVRSVSAGAYFTCTIASDNNAYCWGQNSQGQLGNNTTISESVPIAVHTGGILVGKTVTSLSSRDYHSCVIANDKKAYCWGSNTQGQLGNNELNSSSVPVAVSFEGVLNGKTVKKISVGDTYTCLIASDGQAYCWGLNNKGQLGINSTTANSSAPVAVTLLALRSMQVTIGGISATNIALTSPTTLTATTPTRYAGLADVSITRYDEQTSSMTNSYTYNPAPLTDGISPNSGSLAGGDTATITGSNFTDGMSVSFGSNDATAVTTINDTILTLTVPAGSVVGAVNVTLTAADGQKSDLGSAYTYSLPSPTITSISPASGSMNGGTLVTITGSDFVNKDSGGSWYTVKFATSNATQVNYVNSTTLTAVAPAHAQGSVNIAISNAYSNTATLPSAYTYLADHYVFSGTPLNVSAGQPGKLTIQARNSSNQAAISTVDTQIDLSSSSLDGSFARNLSEAEISRWEHTSVTLIAGVSSVDVWYKDDTAGEPIVTGKVLDNATFNQAQVINSPFKLQVTGVSNPSKVGEPSSVTVRAVDYLGEPLSGYTGSIAFTSTDMGAKLPATYDMTSDDRDIKTFINGVTMATIGTYCITVTDVNNPTITGQQCGIEVQPGNDGAISQLAIISQPQSIPANENSAPITIQTQNAAGESIMVETDTIIYVSSESSTGRFSLDGTNWSSGNQFEMTIARGLTASNVYFKDTLVGTTTLFARDVSTDTKESDFGWKNTSQLIITGVGAANKIVVTGKTDLLVNEQATYTAELQDENGNPVTARSDVVIRVDGNTTSTSLYGSDSPSVSQPRPLEFRILGGSTKGSIVFSDSVASSAGSLTTLQFVDGRAATDTVRLADVLFQVLIVAEGGYPASVNLLPSATQTEAGEPLAIGVQLQGTDGTAVTAARELSVNLLSNLEGEFSFTAEPFTPVSSLVFNRGEGLKTVYFRATLAGTATLAASATNLAGGSAMVDIIGSGLASFGVTAPSYSAPMKASSAAFTISLYDMYGNITLARQDIPAYLFSDQTTTEFAASSTGVWGTTNAIIATGQSSQQFYVKDSALHEAPIQLTVGDQEALDAPDTLITNAYTQLTITAVATDYLVSGSSTIFKNENTTYSVQLRDENGDPVMTDTAVTLELTTSSSTSTITTSGNSNAQKLSTIILTVAPGSSQTTFNFTDSEASPSGNMTKLQLSDTRAVSDTTRLPDVELDVQVIAGYANHAIVTPAASSVAAGDALAVEIQLYNVDDTAVTAVVPMTASLASSLNGEFSLTASPFTAITSVDFNKGDGAKTVYFKGYVDGNTLLSSRVDGLPSATATVTVIGAQNAKLLPNAPQVIAGEALPVTIELYNPSGTPTATKVALTASLASTLDGQFSLTADPFNPITSVSFAVDESQKTVYFSSTLAGTARLSATVGSMNTASEYVEVIGAGIERFEVTPTNATASIDMSSDALTVTSYDIYGNITVASSDTSVYLYSDQATTKFSSSTSGGWTVPWVTLQTGMSTTQFYAKDSSFHEAPVAITVSDQDTLDNPDVAIVNDTLELKIVSQPVATMVISSAEQTIVAGKVTDAMTVQLRRADGNPAVQNGATQVTLNINEGKVIDSATADSEQITTKTIGQYETEVSFYYTGTKSGKHTLIVSYPGSSVATQSITITPEVISALHYTSAVQTVKAGVPSSVVRLGMTDTYGNPVVTESQRSIAVSSSCETGSFSRDDIQWQAVTSVTMAAGALDTSFYYKDIELSDGCTLTAKTSGLTDATQNMVVTTGVPAHLRIDAGDRTIIKGAQETITIHLYDQFGNITTAETTTPIYISSSASTGNLSSATSTIAAGTSTTTVIYRDTVSGSTNISARDQLSKIDGAGTLPDDEITLTYIEGVATRLVVTPDAAIITAGERQAMTIGLVNENGIVVNALENTTLDLKSSVASGAYYVDEASKDVIALTMIARGTPETTVYYTQTAISSGTATVGSANLTSDSTYFTVSSDAVEQIRIVNAPYTGNRALEAGETGENFRINIYDQYGNITSNRSNIVLHATSSVADSRFSGNGEIIIPAGRSTIEFEYTQNIAGAFTLRVSDSQYLVEGEPDTGLQDDTQDGYVNHGAPIRYRFTDSAFSLERGGVSQGLTLDLINYYGKVVPAGNGGVSITLDGNLGSGRFSASENGKFTSTLPIFIAAGETSPQFYYRNDDGQIEDRSCSIDESGVRSCVRTRSYTHPIHAEAAQFGTRYENATQTASLYYGTPVQLAFSTPVRTQATYRASSVMTVERQNQYGKPVVNYSDQTVQLRSTSDSGKFGSSKTNWGVASVTIQDSSADADFYYVDHTAGEPTITVADSLPLVPDINLINAIQTNIVATGTGEPQVINNFLVTNIADPQRQGTQSSVVVVARDATGYVIEDYYGTVTFTSDDSGAILPESYSFNPSSDLGMKTFTNQVAFSSIGEKSVTVIDAAGIAGTQSNITVTDGSRLPVARLAITQPTPPVVVARGLTSDNMTIELLDADGQLTNAPETGMPVQLTSSSATAEFASKPGGPWQSSIVTTISPSLSFTNFYYRDTIVGDATITATDWESGEDSGSIENAQLAVSIHTIEIDGSNTVQSLNAFGVMESSYYLFAHNGDGSIIGSIRSAFNTTNLETGAPTESKWRTQWRQGVELLESGAQENAQSVIIDVNNVVATAGEANFYAVAEATDSDFNNYDEVVSQQQTILTSPWKATVDVAEYVVGGEDLVATIDVFERNIASNPQTVVIQLLEADATNAENPVDVWGASNPGSSIEYVLPTQAAPTQNGRSSARMSSFSNKQSPQIGQSYRLFATTYNLNGYTTSQTLSSPFKLLAQAPVDPDPETTDPGVTPTKPVEPSDPTVISPTDPLDETTVVPDTQTNMPLPANTAKPTTGRDKSPTQAEIVAEATNEAIKKDAVLVSIITATYSTTAVVVVIFLREAYKELARVHRIRRVLKRERQLAQDKDTFLSLSSHYLRTPIAILEASTSMMHIDNNPLLPIIASLRAKSEVLLQSGVEQDVKDIQNPDIAAATRSAYRSIFFWLPIVLSVVLTVAVLALLQTAASGAALNDNLVYACIVSVAIVLIGLFGTRTVYINREAAVMNKTLLLHNAQLFNAKASFITNVKREIGADTIALRKLNGTLKLPLNIQALLEDSIERLENLLTKLELVADINGVVTQPVSFSIHQLTMDALEKHQADSAAKNITITTHFENGYKDKIVQDARLLRYVTSTIIDNAIKFSPFGASIEIMAKRSGDGAVITVNNSSATSGSSEITAKLFEPFNHGQNVNDLTSEGMGLSLYLDKLIMKHVGGAISAKDTGLKHTTSIGISFSSVK